MVRSKNRGRWVRLEQVYRKDTDGRFYGKDMFRVASPLELKKLEAIFRYKVLRMLIARGKITSEMIALRSRWRHSGFHIFCGKRISPKQETAMKNLAQYIIIRASFSQERMHYLKAHAPPAKRNPWKRKFLSNKSKISRRRCRPRADRFERWQKK